MREAGPGARDRGPDFGHASMSFASVAMEALRPQQHVSARRTKSTEQSRDMFSGFSMRFPGDQLLYVRRMIGGSGLSPAPGPWSPVPALHP